LELLKSKNLKIEEILYLKKGLEENEIKNLLQILKAKPREIMRKKEEEYIAQNLDNPNLSEEFLIKTLIKTPKLLERPIVVNGDKAKIGRPVENILEII